jgi:hypothetical protein
MDSQARALHSGISIIRESERDLGIKGNIGTGAVTFISRGWQGVATGFGLVGSHQSTFDSMGERWRVTWFNYGILGHGPAFQMMMAF